jgi:predicted Zn-dependent protease
MSGLAAVLILGTAWYFASDATRPGDGVKTYVPASADEVVEQLQRQSSASKRDLRERLALAAARPESVEIAVAMARRHYDRARREGEPRELGLAQSALGHWWDQAEAPAPVLLMRAAIRQYQHDFPGALVDLQEAIAAEPGNIQAWLSQAAIQQTIGKLKEAARSCSQVVALSDHIAGHVCLADLASMKGDKDALDRIGRQLQGRRVGLSERSWILTVQAEMAERLGRDEDAEGLFRSAIATDTGSYSRVAYADFLLTKGRAGEVAAVLQASPATDAVLLRRAIAFKRTSDPGARAAAAELRQRFETSVSRDDSLHLREMARFALDVDGDATAALALARRNWALQKEPADALLLAAAAKAAGLPAEAAPVRAFASDPGLFDVRLDALL